MPGAPVCPPPPAWANGGMPTWALTTRGYRDRPGRPTQLTQTITQSPPLHSLLTVTQFGMGKPGKTKQLGEWEPLSLSPINVTLGFNAPTKQCHPCPPTHLQ